MEEPFLTIEEQVELLRSRGIAINNQTNTVLMREGYYPPPPPCCLFQTYGFNCGFINSKKVQFV